MFKALTSMTGGHIAVIGALAGVIVFSMGVGVGWDAKKKAVAKEQAKQTKVLDKKSITVQTDTDAIASQLKDKINVRMDGVQRVNTQAIEDAAYRQGVLEGKAAGYEKGFKDAEKIPNTCYIDPAFLPNSLRLDAQSRYEAVFGSATLAGPNASGPVLRGYPLDNAEGKLAD